MREVVYRSTDEGKNESNPQSVVKKLRRGTGQKVRRAQTPAEGLTLMVQIGPTMHRGGILVSNEQTVERLRQRFVEQGFEETLHRVERKQPPVEKLLTGDQEARIIATRLGPPPKGYNNWTLRLLARKVVELEIVESVSYETVRRTLKKNGMTNRKIEYWVIPPEADAEFVAHMEEVLETYEKPYNPKMPVLCMDEQNSAVAERNALAHSRHGHAHGQAGRLRIRTRGTAAIFMFAGSLWLAGVKSPFANERTKVDWAIERARLLEGRYAACVKVILVCDNLNTHTKGAFYEVRLNPKACSDPTTRRIEFCYTPKHGSWLNIAENELSSLTRQCVSDRRFEVHSHSARKTEDAMVERRQHHAALCRLANENRRRPNETGNRFTRQLSRGAEH